MLGFNSLDLSKALKRQQAALLITPYLFLPLGDLLQAKKETYLEEGTLADASDPHAALHYAGERVMNLPVELRGEIASYLPFMQPFKQLSDIEQPLKHLILAQKWHPDGLSIEKQADKNLLI